MSKPKNAIQSLPEAVRVRDPVLLAYAVDALRAKGYTYRECFRVALAGNPGLTEADFDALMEEADDV